MISASSAAAAVGVQSGELPFLCSLPSPGGTLRLTLADKAGAVRLASPLGLWGKGQDWGGASGRLVPTGQVRSRVTSTAPCLCDGLKACPAPVKAAKSFLLPVGPATGQQLLWGKHSPASGPSVAAGGRDEKRLYPRLERCRA